MLKLKTSKSVRKRFKKIGKNKFIRKKAFKGHLLEKKSPKQKRRLKKSILVNKADLKKIRKILIY
jgi:large subunit ribosomal protein L35